MPLVVTVMMVMGMFNCVNGEVLSLGVAVNRNVTSAAPLSFQFDLSTESSQVSISPPCQRDVPERDP